MQIHCILRRKPCSTGANQLMVIEPLSSHFDRMRLVDVWKKPVIRPEGRTQKSNAVQEHTAVFKKMDAALVNGLPHLFLLWRQHMAVILMIASDIQDGQLPTDLAGSFSAPLGKQLYAIRPLWRCRPQEPTHRRQPSARSSIFAANVPSDVHGADRMPAEFSWQILGSFKPGAGQILIAVAATDDQLDRYRCSLY